MTELLESTHLHYSKLLKQALRLVLRETL